MDIYVLDNELTRVRTVATSSECLSATEELELGKAGQLTLSLPISYKDTVKEMNILAIHDRDDRYRLYIVTNRNLNNYTLDIVAISYPNYALSRVGNVKDLRPNNRPLTELIPQVLGNSGWTLNHVDENLPGYTGSFYYLSRLECLSQISEALACEFDFYVTITKNVITGQFVDVVEMLGEDTNRRFEYGTNALEVVAEYDATEVYTQAVGRGKGEETGDGYGRRIEFTDVVWSKANGDPVDKPAGQNWVNDPYENYQLPGNKRPQKIIEFEEITDPNVLLEETYKWLLDNNHPKVQFKAKIVETGALNLGDRVQIIRPDLDIRYKTRVFKLTRNLLNENLTEVEFGDNIATTPMDKLNSITNQVNSTNQALQRVEEQITMIDADGNRITYGPDEPPVKKKGDMWYKTTPDGKTELYIWNGETWELTIGDAIFDDLEQKVNDAMSEADEAKKQADTARNEASSALTKADTALTDALNASQQASNAMSELTSFKSETGEQITEIKGGIQGINVDISDLEKNTNNKFTLLSDQMTSVISNGVNMFPNSIFTDSVLTNYFYGVPSNNNFLVVPKGESDGKTTYGQKKCLKMVASGSRNVELRTNKFIPCKVGDTLSITFDYFNKSGKSNIVFRCRFQKDDGSSDEWLTSTVPIETSTVWKKAQFEVVAPEHAMTVQLMIGNDKSAQDASLTYIDNVLVTSTEVTRNQFVQTTNSTLSKIENLEQKTDTKFLQTDELLALQANKLGIFYPDGGFQCGDVNKYYVDYSSGGVVQYATLNKLNDIYRLWIKGTGVPTGQNYGVKLKDLIAVDSSKELHFTFNYRLFWNSSSSEGVAEVVVTEYTNNNGSFSVVKDNVITVSAQEKLRWYSSTNTFQLQSQTTHIRVLYRNRNVSGDKFESSYTSVYLSNGTDNLSSMLSVANDNINLSVQKGDVINQINVSPENITIAGNKIHITGATSIDNAVIKDSMIANLSASKLTAGTIDANKIKVINLDVNSLSGNKAQFIQAAFKSANSSTTIDSKGIQTKNDHMTTSLNAGRLEFRDKGNYLTGTIETADWLLSNDLDDTLLIKVLGRRQLTVGFVEDESHESWVTPAISIKQRPVSGGSSSWDNVIQFERNITLRTSENRNVWFGDSIATSIRESDSVAIAPFFSYIDTDNNDSFNTGGVGFTKNNLFFRDQWNKITLDELCNGYLKELHPVYLDDYGYKKIGYGVVLRETTINGNPAFVLRSSEGGNGVAINNANVKIYSKYDLIFEDGYGSRITLNQIRKKLGLS